MVIKIYPILLCPVGPMSRFPSVILGPAIIIRHVTVMLAFDPAGFSRALFTRVHMLSH